MRVRTWGARAAGILMVMFMSAGLHYFMWAFSPLIGFASFVLHGLCWILRWVATWGSRPKEKEKEGDATSPKTVLDFYGPAVAKYPTTGTLRALKRASEKFMRAALCVKRDVLLVEVDPKKSGTIDRHGMDLGIQSISPALPVGGSDGGLWQRAGSTSVAPRHVPTQPGRARGKPTTTSRVSQSWKPGRTWTLTKWRTEAPTNGRWGASRLSCTTPSWACPHEHCGPAAVDAAGCAAGQKDHPTWPGVRRSPKAKRRTKGNRARPTVCRGRAETVRNG